MIQKQRDARIFEEPAGEEPAEANPFSQVENAEEPKRRSDMERPQPGRKASPLQE